MLSALGGDPPAAGLVERLADGGELARPHLIDTELVHALRRLVRLGHLSADRASDARTDFAQLGLTHDSHEPLADRIRELRDSLTAHDAVSIALAEALSASLITCDVPPAGAASVRTQIELQRGG